MAVVPIQDTINCRVAGCPNEAKSARGQYAYLCGDHIEAKRLERGSNGSKRTPKPEGALEGGLKALNALAKKADKLEAKAVALRAQADTTAWAAGEARDEFAAKLKELTAGGLTLP